jgi:hypothetical protein
MPLRDGTSRATIGENIKTEENAGRPRPQAIAIALHTARKSGPGIPRPGEHEPHNEERPRGIRKKLVGGGSRL